MGTVNSFAGACCVGVDLVVGGGLMIKCKSKYGICDRCIIDMDSYQSIGGTIICDIAEDLCFDRAEILKKCEHAESDDIHDAALKELFS